MSGRISKTAVCLVVILIGAAFFRLYGLPSQGFFFYDEGAQIYRAQMIRDEVRLPFAEQRIIPNVYDNKPLWLFFIALALELSGGQPAAVQFVSAILGVLTVALCYLFALQIGRSRPNALLSAALMAVSAYHIFYSRLAMPEAAMGLGGLAAIYFYIKSLRSGKYAGAILSGFLLGLTYLINYRVIFLVAGIPLLQLISSACDRRWTAGVRRALLFAVSLGGILLSYAALLSLIRALGLANVPPAHHVFISELGPHVKIYFDILSITTVPYVMAAMEGVALTLLFIIGLQTCRRDPVLMWMAVMILLHLLAGMIYLEKSFRLMADILVFIPVLAAAGFEELYHRWRERRWLRVVPVTLLVLTLGQGLTNAFGQLTFRSAMPQAVAAVKRQYGQAPILTSNRPLVRFYAPAAEIALLRNNEADELSDFAARGYGALILDPQKYIMGTASRNWNDPKLAPLIHAVEARCEPVMIYRHFSPRLLNFFLFEHVGPSLGHTLRLMEYLDGDAGRLTIYDVRSCALELAQDRS